MSRVWTKNAIYAEEAGQTVIETCLNVRPDNNLVGEEQIRSPDQNGEYNFADENEHYEEWHFLFVCWDCLFSATQEQSVQFSGQ